MATAASAAAIEALTLPVRLTIGIIGDGNSATVDSLRETVREILDRILRNPAGTGRTPVKLCVLSTLTEEADRAVVGEILRRHGDARLKVVLPLTPADYLKELSSDASRDDFRALMAAARFPLSLREKPLENDYPPAMRAAAKAHACEDGCQFVVDHCDVLIAVTGGDPNRHAAVIAGALSHAAGRRCPRYIIDTKAPGEFAFVPGESDAGNGFRAVDRFNASLISGGAPARRHDEELFDLSGLPESTAGVGAAIRENLLPYFAAADRTAARFQKIYKGVGLVVFWTAFLSVALVAVGVIFMHSPPQIFLIEFLLLAAIGLLIVYADRKRSHRNWMEYRYLAERIRSALYLAISGVEISPAYAERRLDQGYSGSWAAAVVEEIWDRLPEREACKAHDCEALGRFISEKWIQPQLDYHEANVYPTSGSRGRFWERFGEVVFYCAIFAALAHGLIPYLMPDFHHSLAANGLTLAALVLPALGATAEAIRSHREYKRLAIRSKNMADRLTRLQKSFRLLTPGKLEHLLRKTERTMLRESEDWLALMSHADLYKAV